MGPTQNDDDKKPATGVQTGGKANTSPMSSPLVVTQDKLTREYAVQLDEFYLDLQEEGRRISILDKETIRNRPFPGLRPFKTSEFQLFKGRDGQAEELIKRLKKNHFLAVIGSSGTGKSSLVRAGLIPQLFGGYLQEAGNKWDVAVCRPGRDPIENLAIALSSIKDGAIGRAHIFDNYEVIAPVLDSSIYGILEVDELLNSNRPADGKRKLMIIVDQFEELFRFNRKDLGKPKIENHFVNLLLKASLNPNSSVYVIITMRSEFLGDCVKYRGLPEAINEGQYLVPQLSRNQLKEVIEGPINLAGKEISPGLVELLINEIEESKLKENLDQLPILQHALMRTYQEAIRHGADTIIKYEHYKQVGEMEKALANHAESKFDELGDGNMKGLSKKQAIAKIIFQALTDASTDQKGGRRPTELKNIYAVAASIHATEAEVDDVVNHFRDVDTSFIMPPINPKLVDTGLYPELMLDISHESLMRNWERLNNWIVEEVRFAKLYKTLNERRELNENDTSELVRGALLKELIDWKASHTNNFAWAQRYQQTPNHQHDVSAQEEIYKKNLTFLQESEAASVAAKEAEERKQKEKIRNARKLIFILIGATGISISLVIWAFTERSNAKRNAAYAQAQAVLAREQESRAIYSEQISREQTRIATESEQDAMQQRDSLALFASKIQVLKELADRSRQEALSQSKLAIMQKEKAEVQSQNLELQLVKSELQKQRFYASNLLDPDVKESIVQALFNTSVANSEVIPVEKYVDMDLLRDVNAAVLARERTLSEPITGLRMADNVWKHFKDSSSKHENPEIIENILLDIFKRNIFFTQGIKVASSIPSILAVSNDLSRFAMDNLNAVTIGGMVKNNLEMLYRFSNSISVDSLNDKTHHSMVIALAFVAKDTLISLQNNGKVVVWTNKLKKTILSLPGINSASIAEFSAGGTTLVTASKEENAMKVWNLSDLKAGRPPLSFIDSSTSNRFIKQVRFSPDGTRIVKIYNDGQMEVWSLEEKKRLPQFDTYRYITAANFTPDGKFLMTASSNHNINIFDLSGRELKSLYLPGAAKANTDYPFSRITNLLLRKDWRTMIISQESGDVFIAQRLDEDSIINLTPNFGTQQQYSITLKKLNGSIGGVKTAFFLERDYVITISGTGTVNLWNTQQKFDNLTEALESVKRLVSKSYAEKLQAGEISFEEIRNDSNKSNVRNAALYYYGGIYSTDSLTQVNNINKAISLYEKLSGSDQGTLRNDDLDKIARLHERHNNIERVYPLENSGSIIKRLNKIVSIREDQLKSGFSNATLIRSLANNYNDLSYYSLFASDFESAIRYAQKGLSVDPTHLMIYTNLALAYLLNSQVDLADRIYINYKDREIPSISRSFKDAFLEDLEDLTRAGIIKPNDKRVLRVKNLLSGE